MFRNLENKQRKQSYTNMENPFYSAQTPQKKTSQEPVPGRPPVLGHASAPELCVNGSQLRRRGTERPSGWRGKASAQLWLETYVYPTQFTWSCHCCCYARPDSLGGGGGGGGGVNSADVWLVGALYSERGSIII